MSSIWNKDVKFRQFDSLTGDVKTDVLVIGGGIAGILCAHELSVRGIDYILVDAGRICSSVTSCTTAKITSQHGLIYSKIEKEFNTDFAHRYFLANERAIKKYTELAKQYPCNLELKNNYVYSKNDLKKIEAELKTLNKFTDIAEYSDNLNIPVDNVGAVKFKNQAQFNVLMLLSSLSENLNIYENTKIYKIDNNIGISDKCKIKANTIIIATHFPIINKYGAYYLKMYQHRSYVIALNNAKQLNGMYVDESGNGLSFRNYGDYLLLGGYGHRTGKGVCGYKELERFAIIHYPASEKRLKWATQDCMTLDGIPYIGQYSKSNKNLYVITGFNKWGMTSSMVGAEILADMIMGKKNDFEDIFTPQRTILRPQLAENSIEAIANLCRFSNKRCTHLGCALRWNKEEHSWDCACHGSRFDKNGNVLENPAINKLK